MRAFVLTLALILYICGAFAQSPSELLRQARDMETAGKYEETIKLCDRALASESDLDTAYCLRGTALYKTGQCRKALKNLNKATKLNPLNYESWYAKAMTHAALKDYILSIRDLNKVIDLKPDHLKAWYNRALARGYLEDYDEAIADLDKVIELDSTYVQAWYSRAFWKDASEKYAEAIADYAKVLTLDPGYREAYLAMAVSRYRSGDKAGACETLKKATDMGSGAAEELSERFCQ